MSVKGPPVLVGIVMGSDSDYPVMRRAAEVLAELDVPHEVEIVSAHRTPERMMAYGKSAEERGLKAIVAGAGGAAHLPGMLAALTVVPVIGVPVNVTALQGLDALLSIVQMPAGVPVATVAIDNARNAGLLAAQIVATASPRVREAMREKRAARAADVEARAAKLASGD